MSNKYFSSLLLTLFVFVATLFVVGSGAANDPAFSPGVVFEVETTYLERAVPLTTRVDRLITTRGEILVEGKNSVIRYLKKGPERLAVYQAGRRIFNNDARRSASLIDVYPGDTMYYVIDNSWVDSILRQQADDANILQEEIKSMPKKQREIMEKALRQSEAEAKKPGPKREVKLTGERSEKAGYPCVKYEVYEDGRKIRELWVTDWSNITGGNEAKDAFRERSAFVESVLKRLSAGMEGLFAGQIPYKETDFGKGFPVYVKYIGEDGRLDSETWLKNVRRKRLDPAEFEPRAGSKRHSGFFITE